MLPKLFRCFKSREIALVHRKGKLKHGKCFSFRYLVTPQTKKLLVIISTKVSKSAVRRNTLRRQIQAYFRAHWSHLPTALLIVTLRPSCTRLGPDALKQDLNQIIHDLTC